MKWMVDMGVLVGDTTGYCLVEINKRYEEMLSFILYICYYIIITIYYTLFLTLRSGNGKSR